MNTWRWRVLCFYCTLAEQEGTSNIFITWTIMNTWRWRVLCFYCTLAMLLVPSCSARVQ
jgi:hypothetical protein